MESDHCVNPWSFISLFWMFLIYKHISFILLIIHFLDRCHSSYSAINSVSLIKKKCNERIKSSLVVTLSLGVSGGSFIIWFSMEDILEKINDGVRDDNRVRGVGGGEGGRWEDRRVANLFREPSIHSDAHHVLLLSITSFWVQCKHASYCAV